MRIKRPCGLNVLIAPNEEEEMYRGSVHLPDTAKQKSQEGTVIAVGEWVKQVQPGDYVFFSRKQAVEVEFDRLENNWMYADFSKGIIIDERAIAFVKELDPDDHFEERTTEQLIRDLWRN